MNPYRLVIAAFVAAVGLALAGEGTAFGYELNMVNGLHVRWPTNLVQFELDALSLSTDDRTATLTAMQKWQTSGATVHIQGYDGYTGAGFNGESEIARTCSALLIGSSTARAITQWDILGQITESDIYLKGTTCGGQNLLHETDKYETWAYGGPHRPLVNTMVHELGHSLGLLHENDVYNVMGSEFNVLAGTDTTMFAYVGADAALGAAALYGMSFNFPDVSVTHWKWTGRIGANDEYSQHGRTFVLDVNGRPRTNVGTAAEPRYLVWRGEPAVLEVQYETMGLGMGAPVPLDVYLSDDDMITLSDHHLTGTTMFAAPYVNQLQSVGVTIPVSTPLGPRTLGARVSPHPSQNYETANDATYVHVEVVDMYSSCTPLTPCPAHMGDCNSDADCEAGLICTHNIGADYGLSNHLVDICLPHVNNFCSPDHPCLVGEGDCDDDADCGSFTCFHNIGLLFGYSNPQIDVCL